MISCRDVCRVMAPNSISKNEQAPLCMFNNNVYTTSWVRNAADQNGNAPVRTHTISFQRQGTFDNTLTCANVDSGVKTQYCGPYGCCDDGSPARLVDGVATCPKACTSGYCCDNGLPASIYGCCEGGGPAFPDQNQIMCL